MSEKSAFDYIIELVGLQAETAGAVAKHEDAINDLSERIDSAPTPQQVQLWIAEAKDPLWVRVFIPACATIMAAFVLWIFGLLSGHMTFQVHWTPATSTTLSETQHR